MNEAPATYVLEAEAGVIGIEAPKKEVKPGEVKVVEAVQSDDSEDKPVTLN